MEQGKPFSATESPLVDFDAVCQKVRTAFEPARAHAVSLHDEKGDVLWLSESSMGPDEHNAVREALETFSHSDASPVLAFDLGDARSAVLLRAVNARRALVGAVMVIMDTRAIKPDPRGLMNLMTPKLQRALSDFAGMRPDIAPPAVAPAAAAAKGKTAEPAGLKSPASSASARVRALAAAAPASFKTPAASPAGKAPIKPGPGSRPLPHPAAAARSPAAPA